jgi:MFS transporter, MHS family, citrate/tricarballylate:H+ symporter
VNGVFAVFGDFASGMLSDRVGRKPLMLSSVTLLILFVVPSFIAMEHFRSAVVLYAATAVLTLLLSGTIGPALVTITETLPRAVRSGALSLIYAVAIAVAGGSTQFTIKWLSDATGNPLAPAWYVTGAMVIGGVAMLIVAESAPVRTARR